MWVKVRAQNPFSPSWYLGGGCLDYTTPPELIPSFSIPPAATLEFWFYILANIFSLAILKLCIAHFLRKVTTQNFAHILMSYLYLIVVYCYQVLRVINYNIRHMICNNASWFMAVFWLYLSKGEFICLLLFIIVVVVVELRTKPRALYLLGNYSTTELHPNPSKQGFERASLSVSSFKHHAYSVVAKKSCDANYKISTSFLRSFRILDSTFLSIDFVDGVWYESASHFFIDVCLCEYTSMCGVHAFVYA